MAVATSYPGVYVQEVSSGVRPIAGASTSVAAFIGQAERGLIGEAVQMFNFTEFQNTYGGFMSGSFLTHAVYHYFNNGGGRCYIVRVAGENTETAAIELRDRGTTPEVSLTLSAVSAGVWGNQLSAVVSDGTINPGNEFDMAIFQEIDGEHVEVEAFENLSMVSGASNFVETALSGSGYVRASVNETNTNVQHGSSTGSAPPEDLTGLGTHMRVNVDADGYQEVDLQDAVSAGTVTDLATATNIADAITAVVSALEPQRTGTSTDAFDLFSCEPDSATGVLVLQSGSSGFSSSVTVAPAANEAENATGLLNIGVLEGGVELLGGAVTRPAVTPADTYYELGDHAPTPGTGVESATEGRDGDPVTTDQPYIDAFRALDGIEDVSLIAVPGIGSTAVVAQGMSYAQITRPLGDCFFIGDMSQDEDTVSEIQTFWAAIATKNSYGAVYAPWVRTIDPTGASPEPILVPPSGFVAGIYARTDSQRGVWKSPAGVAASLSGAVGLAVNFTDTQHGVLNPINVNIIRQFAASGIVLWGARTVTSDAEWTYLAIRRMVNFLKVSIYRGIQWAVFEPNDEPLWADLRLNIGAFMNRLFRQGAFQGGTPADAYFVKCDSETTTQADIDAGVVNVKVGFAPLKPAEFVVVEISQKAGGV